MTSLLSFLEAANYQRVPLMRNGVGHFETPGMLNGRAVRVLIDTGAANTVIRLPLAQELGLEMQAVATKGGGAGGVNLDVFQVQGVDLRLGEVVPRLANCFAMDLSHVNTAFAQKGMPPVDVILGVEVFEAQAAIIDYGSASLFLRGAA